VLSVVSMVSIMVCMCSEYGGVLSGVLSVVSMVVCMCSEYGGVLSGVPV